MKQQYIKKEFSEEERFFFMGKGGLENKCIIEERVARKVDKETLISVDKIHWGRVYSIP